MPGSMVVAVCAAAGAAMAAAARAISIRISASSHGYAGEHRLEDSESILGPEEWIDDALGVRHHSEHVTRVVHDAGDGTHGAIRAPPFVRITGSADIAEHDAPFALQFIERIVIGGVTPVTMRDGDAQHGAAFIAVGE